MIHLPDDDFENNDAFSSPCSAPPIDAIPEEPFDRQDAQAPSPEPASENVVQLPMPQTETPQKSFEKQAEDSFRMAIGSNAQSVEGMYSAAGETYQTVTHAMRASAEEWVAGFTRINTKLFEFGRMNAQNNMDFMRAVSGVRTVRDAVDVQTAYLRGQYDVMSTQLRELQTMTTEVAGKTALPFKEQLTRAAQLGRMC